MGINKTTTTELKEEAEVKAPVKPKMRVQLLDDELRVIQDRLVDQTTEFYNGPKEKHTNPFRLEVVLSSKNDIDSLKSYLDSLAGNLPIKELQSRGRPSTALSKELDSPREDILLQVENLINDGSNQDDVIKYLRNLGFVFLVTEDVLRYFPDFPFDNKDVGEPNHNGQYPKSMSWMVRRIKMGKMPISDKYDPMIIFGFNIMGERDRKVVSYLYKTNRKRYKVEVPKKNALKFANFEMAKMPHFMTEDERFKWSTEMRMLMLDQNKKPSKFFVRWLPEIQLPDIHKRKLEHLSLL